MINSLINKVEAIKPFSENEAWVLFKIVALSEAVGWALLISALLIHKNKLPGQSIAIPIAGQIHGIFFIAYFVILIATYSSLEWSRSKFIVAVISGVPPFGTLIFEQFVAHRRDNIKMKIHLSNLILVMLSDKSLLESIKA